MSADVSLMNIRHNYVIVMYGQRKVKVIEHLAHVLAALTFRKEKVCWVSLGFPA